ncbi:unnamed protein product [Arabidopsis lyrata]|uniref:Expressed protein n=1 Tax=Arabidopsis lyrata subsp. lyrata TaxID=81972 RepID=D7MWJ2_ARALL|nr:uncharacterized protein LOC9298908 [Arabidopsis lyrata subsp. lyrata]EFH39091.1 expressed protein [Arabidopsis lyrata subsp. lyrata]CAH8267646.1 unnamed protein product [Arabidopsis lyrata]|eukprot:XP_002862833.1 uncharacterized protein LOC9298908 [Arabidopsis lyrata subsp. lyrata]
MAPKKRKASAIESEEGSEKMEQMKKIFEQFKEKINDLNKELLTIADLDFSSLHKSNSGAAEFLLSWRSKKPELINDHSVQLKDECWAHAFARGLSAAMKQRGCTDNFPTAELLVKQIDRRCLSKSNALIKSINAAPSLREFYGCDLVVHHRPKMTLLKENEEFERFIERRLAIGQVAMCFPYLPGYSRFNHKNKAVFRPNAIDIQAMRYELLDDHCAVITGRGVLFENGKAIEFWEIQETRGPHFADGGYTRLERYKGLITEVYEFKFDRP